MRTDCTIIKKPKIKCNRIYIISGYEKRCAEKGDFIYFKINEEHNYGRVICGIKADEKTFICIARFSHHHFGCSEFWVDPEDVYRVYPARSSKQALWFFSDKFLETEIETARNCFNETF